ncbi:MAG: SgcJ/EcaC family oxidoreductase [Sphingomonas sp.]|nr:SgcJ/EcaC family oxidoreductase [Sphingomonas sp.]
MLAAGVASCDKLGPGKTSQADVAAVKQALATVEAGWNEAFHSKNLDGLVEPYASDAVFVLPGLPAQVGTSAIRNTYVEALKDPNFDVTLTSDRVEVAQSGDLAFSQGHLTMKGTDPKTKQPTTTMTGPYLTVFKKQADGSWKAIQDWVAANPPSTPAG